MLLNNNLSYTILTLSGMGGAFLGPPCRKIVISPEPDLRWTSDQSVNSSLSVAVQEKKTQRALSFSVEAWRPNEVQEHLFPNSEIEIFIDFC